MFKPFPPNDVDWNSIKIDFNLTFVNVLATDAIRNGFETDMPF